MTRFGLILAAVLIAGSPAVAQRMQGSEVPQPPSVPLRVQPLPHFRRPSTVSAEPLPAWNIHGHAEAIPNQAVIQPLETGSSIGVRLTAPPPFFPRVENVAAAMLTKPATHSGSAPPAP